MELEDAAGICNGADGGFVWLRLFEPTPEELADVQSHFGPHDTDIEELEEVVFKGAVAPSGRIYSLRREVTDFYRAVHPLVAPLDAITKGAHIESSPELRAFFRDVSDHVKLVEEEIVAQRDLLA